MTIDRPPFPTEDRVPAWRLACLAYREKRPGWCQSTKRTSQAVWPLPWNEASAEAVNAIAYLSRHHPE
jgi:hypothetical protein